MFRFGSQVRRSRFVHGSAFAAVLSHLVKQCLGVSQIGSVKSFGEPRVDWCQQVTSISMVAFLLPQTRPSSGRRAVPRISRPEKCHGSLCLFADQRLFAAKTGVPALPRGSAPRGCAPAPDPNSRDATTCAPQSSGRTRRDRREILHANRARRALAARTMESGLDLHVRLAFDRHQRQAKRTEEAQLLLRTFSSIWEEAREVQTLVKMSDSRVKVLRRSARDSRAPAPSSQLRPGTLNTKWNRT